MPDRYILSLARDYLALIALMKSGDYDGDELRELSAQRTITHDQLMVLFLALIRSPPMSNMKRPTPAAPVDIHQLPTRALQLALCGAGLGACLVVALLVTRAGCGVVLAHSITTSSSTML